MEFNLQYSDFLITNSIDKYADDLYTMLGYPVQTGDSGEEALHKGAIKTRQLTRVVTKKARKVRDIKAAAKRKRANSAGFSDGVQDD